ncbi:hypothetical protein KDW_56230 [Dictyobacter vulcani]|uniref:Uncharacterized protein n=1 Tax=Dictyobacter vulcani TaxID=2607529 RepID=A0A5J4KY83_9CHLR|nr:hypothetical protein [Dictyobacter vulcani]GER91461.1 hypothetical protein KDW_56230 [Dictyobacter vulcani]
MVLNQEHEEQNQHTWRSRVARERRGLSVSVEETLGDASSGDFSWVDEDGRGATSFTRSVHDTSLVPPRFSLQSRTVEAIRSDHAPGADDSSYVVVSSPEDGERKSHPTAQNTNALLRFAQRLTSSFVAFNTATSSLSASEHLTEPVGLEPAAREISRSLKASSLASIADIEVCTASTMTGAFPKDIHRSNSPYPTSSRDPHSRQRLAGRTTRIRLEVVPGAASLKEKERLAASQHNPSLSEVKDSLTPVPEQAGANTTGIHLKAIAPLHQERGSTSVHLPTIGGSRTEPKSDPGTTQCPFPIVDKSQSDVAHQPSDILNGTLEKAPQGALSGSGFFASGQRETTIANPYITSTSVVLTTLTSNPGPVVVQYITLQSQVGFTVHLTAPPTMRTSFNYIVLLGELF